MPNPNLLSPETIVKSVTIQDQLDTIINLLHKTDYTAALLALTGGLIGALIIGGVTWHTTRMNIKEENRRRLREEKQEELEKKQKVFAELVGLGKKREKAKHRLLTDHDFSRACNDGLKQLMKEGKRWEKEEAEMIKITRESFEKNIILYGEIEQQFHQAAENLTLLNPDIEIKKYLNPLLNPEDYEFVDENYLIETPINVSLIKDYIITHYTKPMDAFIVYYRKILQVEAQKLQQAQ
ncbi:MAG: hypothetical protein ABIK15_02575 [Pseudomonadota bacterium]